MRIFVLDHVSDALAIILLQQGVLTEPMIAIIIMNRDNGKLFQYSNESMAKILMRYANFSGPSEIRRKEDVCVEVLLLHFE